MKLHPSRHFLVAGSIAIVLAIAAACSGPSSSVSPTGPTASSGASGANFSPNPEVTPTPTPHEPTPTPPPPTPTPPPPTPTPPPPGNQGCTPGYWKANAAKGAFSWVATGYSPNQSVGSVFAAGSFNSLSLLDALQLGGGPGVAGATEILLRAAVAALLNAANPGVAYPWSTAQVISGVNTAIASGNRGVILALATQLDGYNNLGCPLDNSGN